ncbi:MAG: histidine kinase [Saprospiraceae bacterium]|nr:histidine kinase [Saprospiraceae bacterium]
MKRLKNLSDMNLKLAELESESLRAQMNPHFIFNSLNSIKSYIIKSKKEEAADYLTTFSKLMRAVLNNSKQKEISLKHELEALSLYLQIEQLRLNHKFDYEINVSDDIKTDRIGFPPLIIQPFVENSIWHGFINKKSKGHLKINVNKNDDSLNVEVLDDGIGREASKKIQQSRGGERSYGIAITENRLSNIARKAEIQIIDLFHENGMSAGTRVEINVPLKVLDKN